MADVFISYSRKDIAFTQKLHTGLIEAGLETWIDWQDIPPSTDWMDEIHESIEEADAFIFIISKKSIDSEICSQEVGYAAENNKRLIPIVIDDIDPASVPHFVAALNWILFREDDDFEASVKLLLEAIHTDQAWVKAHTRYQIRALEWDRNHQASAYLLRGSDIQEAETWLTQTIEKDPHPTDLQREYIFASRRANIRRQRLVFGGLGVGLIIALGLSAFAFLQRGVAIEQRDLQATAEAKAVSEAQSRATAEAIAVSERDVRATAQAETQAQRDIALSQYLAAESSNLSTDQLDLKLLLSIAASRFQSGPEASSSLLEALFAESNFSGIVMQDSDFAIQSLALSEDGSLMAMGSEQGEIRVLNTQSGEVLHTLSHDKESESILRLAFSGDGSTLISVNSLDQTLMWDLASDVPQSKMISAYTDWKHFLAINPDGSEVAALTSGGDVAIWDPASGGILQRLSRSNRFNEPMIFSPDGKNLAAFGEDNTIHLWIREDGSRFSHYISLPDKSSEIVYRPPLNEQYTLAFQPQGTGLLFGTGHNTSYWDFDAESISSSDASYSIGFNSEGLPMAFSLSDSQPYQWEVLSQETIGSPFEINFGGDPSKEESLGYIWNPLTQECFPIWATPTGGTLILRYSMNYWSLLGYTILDSQNFKSIVHVPQSESNLMIATGCAKRVGDQDCSQGLIQFWGGEDWDPIGDPTLAHSDWISSIAISPDNSLFATASEDNTVQIWDLDSNSPLGDPIALDYIGIDARLKFHPSSKLIALYDGWDRIYLLDVEKQVVLSEPFSNTFVGDTETLRAFAFSPDGHRMAVIHLGKPYEFEPDLSLGTSSYKDYANYNLSPEGKYLVIDYGKAILSMWDITEPAAIELLFHVVLKDSLRESSGGKGMVPIKNFYPLAFHPDGLKLAVGMHGAAMLVDAETGGILFSPPENLILYEETSDLTFSQDGQWIAAANTAGKIQLVDASSGIEIGPALDGPGKIQGDLAFDPDNLRLFVVFHDEKITMWEISLSHWQDLACSMANRELTQEEWQYYLGEAERREICPQVP